MLVEGRDYFLSGSSRESVIFPNFGISPKTLIGTCPVEMKCKYKRVDLNYINNAKNEDSAGLTRMGQFGLAVFWLPEGKSSEIKFRVHHREGRIVAINVEDYGSIMARRESLLCMEQGVRMHPCTLDTTIGNAAKIGTVLQRFSGKGTIFLGLPGGDSIDGPKKLLHEEPAIAGKPGWVNIIPGTFGAITRRLDIKLKFSSAYDHSLNDAWGFSSWIRIYAKYDDGYYWTCSGSEKT